MHNKTLDQDVTPSNFSRSRFFVEYQTSKYTIWRKMTACKGRSLVETRRSRRRISAFRYRKLRVLPHLGPMTELKIHKLYGVYPPDIRHPGFRILLPEEERIMHNMPFHRTRAKKDVRHTKTFEGRTGSSDLCTLLVSIGVELGVRGSSPCWASQGRGGNSPNPSILTI